ncbi:MAG: haloacid dehalogenase type II [Alphaproteobacteria bacterium]
MTHPRFADIGACVFDAYGTLFDFNSAAARHRAALGDKAERLSALWRTKQLEYTWLRSLMGAYADFWQVTGDGLDYALASLGLGEAGLKDRLMEAYLELGVYPEVPAMLKTLSAAGMRTAILSNGAPAMLDAAVRNAGIGGLLDAVLSVDAVGVYKPDKAVYGLAVERLGVPAPRISFQSSNAWDAAGAAHFGFRVAWINRFGQQRERLPAAPDAELRSLAELPPLLGLGGTS